MEFPWPARDDLFAKALDLSHRPSIGAQVRIAAEELDQRYGVVPNIRHGLNMLASHVLRAAAIIAQ